MARENYLGNYAVISCAASLTAGASDQSEPIRGLNQQGEPRAPLNWAERLRRVFRVDISNCPL
ncbi:MAG: hypothetical protein VB957_11225, partial [Pseudomonadales bacterium]